MRFLRLWWGLWRSRHSAPPVDSPARIVRRKSSAADRPDALAPGDDLAVDAPGDLVDQLVGLGNVRFPEAGDVPEHQVGVAVRLHGALGGVLQQHLLLQQALHEHRAYEALVQLRRVLHLFGELVHHVLQVVPLALGHAGVDVLQILPQVDGLALHAEALLQLPLSRFIFLLGLGHGRLVGREFLGGYEVQVEAAVKYLLLPL